MVLDMRFVGKHGCLRTTRWMAFPSAACQDARFDMALLAALPSKGRVFMTWARSGPKSYKVATHNKTCVYDFFMFKTKVRSDNEQPLEHVHTHGVTQLRGSCCNMAKTTNHN